MICVEICMGSSCFTRGNKKTLELMERYIQDYHLSDRVGLRGRLCLDHCACGPHIVVDNVRHDLLAPEGALVIIEQLLAENA